MKISEDGKSYEVSVSLSQALSTIGALKALKKLGKEALCGENQDGKGKAAELVECMQVAIDVMCLFIQDNFGDELKRMGEELTEIKEAEDDSGGTETAESTEPEV